VGGGGEWREEYLIDDWGLESQAENAVFSA